jgi:transposase
VRSRAAYQHTTVPEHMPKSHQVHLQWTPSRLIYWAEEVGATTAEVVRTVLERNPHPEMGYRACLGILRLEKIYSRQRLEAASQHAVQFQVFSYQSLKSILQRSLDREPVPVAEAGSSGPQHENPREPLYYDPPSKLVQ